jgi:hypothetical protein
MHSSFEGESSRPPSRRYLTMGRWVGSRLIAFMCRLPLKAFGLGAGETYDVMCQRHDHVIAHAEVACVELCLFYLLYCAPVRRVRMPEARY